MCADNAQNQPRRGFNPREITLIREGYPDARYRAPIYLERGTDGSMMVGNRSNERALALFEVFQKHFEEALVQDPDVEPRLVMITHKDTGATILEIALQASAVNQLTANLDAYVHPDEVLKLHEANKLTFRIARRVQVTGSLADRLTNHVRTAQDGRNKWRELNTRRNAPPATPSRETVASAYSGGDRETV